MVFSCRDYGTTAQILDGLPVRATKKSSSPVVLDFPSSISAILFFVLHSVHGADGDPKGVGNFPTKNAFLLFDITFYFDGAGKESLLQVASFSMAFLGLVLFSFSFFSAAALPFLSHQNCLLYFSRREGETKRKKGDHKTSFGHWEDFQQIRETDCSIFLFSCLSSSSFLGASSLLPRPWRPFWGFSAWLVWLTDLAALLCDRSTLEIVHSVASQYQKWLISLSFWKYIFIFMLHILHVYLR
jgi:hypothetical protein